MASGLVLCSPAIQACMAASWALEPAPAMFPERSAEPPSEDAARAAAAAAVIGVTARGDDERQRRHKGEHQH